MRQHDDDDARGEDDDQDILGASMLEDAMMHALMDLSLADPDQWTDEQRELSDAVDQRSNDQ